METNNKTNSTEEVITLSSEGISTYSTTSTDCSEDIDMPFRYWVRGIYENISRKYKFTANAPGAHPLFTEGEYTIRCNGTESSTLMLLDSDNFHIDPSVMILASKSGIDYSVTVKLEYNHNYHFVIVGNSDSTNYFEVRIDYRSYTSAGSCGYVQTLEPHGNYLTFTCDHAAVCNDGIGESHGDSCHQCDTSYMNGTLNADIHRYIVIPQSSTNFASLIGCVGVVVRSNKRYEFGIVAEVGPTRDSGIIDEFSVKMIKDLGFETDGAYYVSPEESVTTYVFPDTKRSSWDGCTLNDDAEFVGMDYYY